MTAKTATIIKMSRSIIPSRPDRDTETTGTLEELIQHFAYTLECGASYAHQKGCKKVNTSPKTFKALVTALNNANENTRSGASWASYCLKEA